MMHTEDLGLNMSSWDALPSSWPRLPSPSMSRLTRCLLLLLMTATVTLSVLHYSAELDSCRSPPQDLECSHFSRVSIPIANLHGFREADSTPSSSPILRVKHML